jgi:hypothetical protein
MIRHLCIQSFSFSKIGASLSKMRSEPGDAYNAWSRNALEGFEIETLQEEAAAATPARGPLGVILSRHISEPDR